MVSLSTLKVNLTSETLFQFSKPCAFAIFYAMVNSFSSSAVDFFTSELQEVNAIKQIKITKMYFILKLVII